MTTDEVAGLSDIMIHQGFQHISMLKNLCFCIFKAYLLGKLILNQVNLMKKILLMFNQVFISSYLRNVHMEFHIRFNSVSKIITLMSSFAFFNNRIQA